MPVPVINFMVVVLRNSLAPINRIITNVCVKGNNYEKKYSFMFFKQFGYGCHYGNAAMNRFIKNSTPGALNDPEDKEEEEVFNPNNRELFKIGVEWWSEIFIFYGILSAVAFWELGKYAKKSRIQLQRVDNLEKSHLFINNEVLDLEDRIENVQN